MNRRNFLLSPLALEGAAAQPASARPHLFYTAERARQIAARVRRDPRRVERWQAFLAHARRLLETRLMPEADAARGSGDDASFGGASQQMAAMGTTLGLAYHATGDSRYAAGLRDALLHFASYSSWHGPGFPRRTPPWHSELNTARFCLGVAAGYDALHATLSPADRRTVAGALTRMGILATLEDWVLPGTRIHALDSMGHNWWAVCVSNAGVAALALLGEEPRAPAWLARVDEAIAEWFAFTGNVLQNKSRTFDSQGAFYEGVNYDNYALSEYLRYRLACANVFPGRRQPEFAPLARSCEFFLRTLYPGSKRSFAVNFGDSGDQPMAAPTLLLLAANGLPHPGAGWYLSRTGPRDPDAFEFLVPETALEAAPPRLSRSILYPDIGWALLRDSWEDDATLLAVKSGFTWNHTHADAGSFLLYHAGAPLLIDSGSCGYGRREYSRYYVQSEAHNVVLVNGQGEPSQDHFRGVKFPGRLHALVDHLGVKYVYADATGPMARYCTRNYRHWLWLDGAILIFDDLETHDDAVFDWLLHYAGTAEADGAGLVISNEGARAAVQCLYPPGVELRDEAGLAEHQPDRRIPYRAFHAPQAARRQKFIVAVVPYPAGSEDRPEVTPVEGGENSLGVRVRRADTVTDVFLNLQADGRRMHLNSNNTIAGWETDAYLLAWTRPAARAGDPAAITRFFVSCGSYLRRGGQLRLDSLSKVDAVWQPGAKPLAQVHGQPVRKVRFS